MEQRYQAVLEVLGGCDGDSMWLVGMGWPARRCMGGYAVMPLVVWRVGGPVLEA